jgi:hypothetical protein
VRDGLPIPLSMSSGGLYLLIGPDRPKKLQRVQQLERSLGVQALDRHHVDGATCTAPALVALCRQQPAASPFRLIVVDQAHRLDRACVDALRAHRAAITQTAAVVLLVDMEVSARHPLAYAGAPFVVEPFPSRDVPAAKPFAFTDALGTRDVATTLSTLHEQMQAGKDALEVLGLVAWQLNRWVTVKRLLTAGYRLDQIAAVTGWRPWQVERAQAEVRDRSLISLQQALERCWRLDVDAKSGRTVAELAVEQLVMDVCVGTGR